MPWTAWTTVLLLALMAGLLIFTRVGPDLVMLGILALMLALGILSPEEALSGFGNPGTAQKIKNIPVWCFHGDADNQVNVSQSRNFIKALKDAGAEPKYTEYPGVGHNSWDTAYATDELYDWLLQQHR